MREHTNRCTCISLTLCLAVFATVETAIAGLQYSFEFDQSNYVVAPNGTVDVKVFLEQTGTPGLGEVNVLGGTGAVGMTGTGVVITFPTGSNDAQVLSTMDITGNSDFDNFGFDPITSVSAGEALLSQSAFLLPPVLGTTVAPETYDLLIGTFAFTAGSAPGQVTPITALVPLFPHSEDNVANTSPFPTALASITSGSATITVKGSVSNPAVPEPTSVLMGLEGMLIVATLAWRRRLQRGA